MKTSASFLKGTFTALVTPFTAGGREIDYESLESLIEFQLQNGVDGMVVCGSTGEAATLSDSEYRDLVSFVRKYLKGRLPCVAGIGTNSTSRACEMARTLHELGLEAMLVVAPPYNKPSQEGIIAHFREIHRASPLPIVAYNIPGRAVANILPSTVAAMAEQGLITGIKEASASMDQVIDLSSLVAEKISILSGEDSLTHAIMASGGRGVISATANIIPGIFHELTALALEGKWEEAFRAQLKALPVIRAMFTETNPVPVKAALALRGIIKTSAVRLPLLEAREETVEKIRKVLPL